MTSNGGILLLRLSEDCAIASYFEMANKENDNFQPMKKKVKVAKQKQQVLLERFQKPKIDEEMKRISKGYMLRATLKALRKQSGKFCVAIKLYTVEGSYA